LKFGQVPPILALLLLNIDNLRKSFGRLKESVQTEADAPSFWLETKQQVVMCGTSGSGQDGIPEPPCVHFETEREPD
jgi:hypothetical protein